MAVLVGNTANVKPGERAFVVMSNACDYFELGSRDGDDVWLEGDIVGPDREFLFNGRLFLPDGRPGTIIDNFPKSTPEGWTRRPAQEVEGYDLVDANGEVIFGYRVNDNLCEVTVGLYRKDGGLAAHGGQGGLVTDGIAVTVGRGGIRIEPAPR